MYEKTTPDIIRTDVLRSKATLSEGEEANYSIPKKEDDYLGEQQ